MTKRNIKRKRRPESKIDIGEMCQYAIDDEYNWLIEHIENRYIDDDVFYDIESYPTRWWIADMNNADDMAEGVALLTVMDEL